MLPGYGFSTLPDFQPHLHAFHCRRGDSPDMWMPGPGDTDTPPPPPRPSSLSDSRDARPPLLRQHQHIAVCQQETLAFLDLPDDDTDTDGFLSSLDRDDTTGRLTAVACSTKRQCQKKDPKKDPKNGVALSRKSSSGSSSGSDAATDTEPNHEGSDSGLDVRNSHSESLPPDAESPVLDFLRKRTSLFLPLTPYPGVGDPFEPLQQQQQEAGSPSSPTGSEGLDLWRPHRRTSQNTVKEKSIRKSLPVRHFTARL